jgi:magnesium chelatase accessory protein
VTDQRQLEDWNWPHRDYSQFHRAGGLRWHVQRRGTGPALLLLHGTGASLHSWAGLAPLLWEQHEVVAVDLPGHGFSELPGNEQMSLPGMAAALGGLLDELGLQPELIVGHSAGAAVAAQMCLAGLVSPAALVSVNGALLALPGLTGQFFSISARLLAGIPTLPAWVAGLGGRQRFTQRLIDGTGSTLGDAEVEYYRQLVSHPRHVAAALRMMANWDLESLQAKLPELRTPTHLVVCEQDRTVPPSQSYLVARHLAESQLHRLEGLGHLGHEEDPARFAQLLLEIAGR